MRLTKAGKISKKTGRVLQGHIAICKTTKLRLRTTKNYLNRRCYMNVIPDKNNILWEYSKRTNGEFNILNNIPLDSMHTIFHCAITWLMEGVWFSGKVKKDAKFSPALMQSLELKLRKVKGCLPYAIHSAGVGTKPLAKFNSAWSCTEKRNFLLYVAIIIMRDDLMDVNAYKILLALHHAILLLVGSRHLSAVPEQYLKKAEENLLYVVEKSQRMYGLDFPRYTFHCLLHIVSDLRANRCRLDYCSMFRYENSMKFFIHVLDKRSGARVHAQIRNSLLRKKLSDVVLPPQ
jgi:hypothetical protein